MVPVALSTVWLLTSAAADVTVAVHGLDAATDTPATLRPRQGRRVLRVTGIERAGVVDVRLLLAGYACGPGQWEARDAGRMRDLRAALAECRPDARAVSTMACIGGGAQAGAVRECRTLVEPKVPLYQVLPSRMEAAVQARVVVAVGFSETDFGEPLEWIAMYAATPLPDGSDGQIQQAQVTSRYAETTKRPTLYHTLVDRMARVLILPTWPSAQGREVTPEQRRREQLYRERGGVSLRDPGGDWRGFATALEGVAGGVYLVRLSGAEPGGREIELRLADGRRLVRPSR